VHEPVTRGPRRALTLEQIAEAGIALALAGGVGPLSMAKIASRLGVGTMSLYRYVSSKDELLALMVDTALGPAPALDGATGWREALAGWAARLRDGYRRHQWSLRVPISGPPLGPNNVAWLDAALAGLAETPLSEQDKLSTVLLVSGFVRNEETLLADLTAGAGDRQVMPGYGETIGRLIGPERFPALRRAIDSGALDDDDDIDQEFDFGLERILDGVAALIARGGGAGSGRRK
jgi:AcrR family transcriptional regulator